MSLFRIASALVLSATTAAAQQDDWSFPNPLQGPNPLSLEKFDGRYTHQRKTLGYMIDSRRKEVAAWPEKRALLAETLDEWCHSRTKFTLREISSLHGSLETCQDTGGREEDEPGR